MTRDLSEITPAEATEQAWPPGGGMAWDVGANVGMTLPLLTALYERVIAFEPAIESFTKMKTEWAGKPGVQLMNWAAAGHDGFLSLAVHSDPIVSGQLVAPGMRWDWGPETARRDVPCVTLDRVAVAHGIPDFVKIDTEGGELKVLQGAVGLLARRETSWQVEFHSAELREACETVLTAAGYDIETGRPDMFAEGSDDWLAYGWMKAVPHAGN